MLKFNNVEMLKSMLKMLKTPAAGIRLERQKFFFKKPLTYQAGDDIKKTEGGEKNEYSNLKPNKQRPISATLQS